MFDGVGVFLIKKTSVVDMRDSADNEVEGLFV